MIARWVVTIISAKSNCDQFRIDIALGIFANLEEEEKEEEEPSERLGTLPGQKINTYFMSSTWVKRDAKNWAAKH